MPIVELTRKAAKVREEVVDAGADESGENSLVPFGGRREHVPVEAGVEVVHAPVEAFPRVINISRVDNGLFDIVFCQVFRRLVGDIRIDLRLVRGRR